MVCPLFSLFLKKMISLGVKLSIWGCLLGYGARTLESFLLLAAEVKFVRVVVHAAGVGVHLLGALLVKFFQAAIKTCDFLRKCESRASRRRSHKVIGLMEATS